MTTKSDARKAALRDRLIDAAEARIATGGIDALKARDLARDAGCSVGAIYNVFDDLNALSMAVNGRTFRALGQWVSDAVAQAQPGSAQDQLVVMAKAYLSFANDRTLLWRALFDLRMTSDGTVPDWYLEELGALFALIMKPLREIYPDRSGGELDLMVRALFSSVHGVVLLGLERRISAVPVEQLEEMLTVVLREIGSPNAS